jgi:DnaJ-class molecular chaperone
MPTKTKSTYPCPRCDGKGHVPGMGHVANGVCFKCGGRGYLFGRPSVKPVQPNTEYQERMIKLILEADLSGMTYDQLNTLRDFAHYPNPHYPNLLATWRERGDPHFFARQEDRLREMYANR